MVCREASHAGSWYTASGSQLNAQLEGWLSQAQSTAGPARAIIAPYVKHAGYTYCGACAAHAYKQVDPSITRRVFILGPSHHVPLSRCALSPAEVYRTPLYDLRIDQKVYADLWKTGMFERMSLQTDEDEHSIEMHLPYTAKAMESHKDEFSIVPVLVGALSESKEQEYGKLLSKYLADPSNLFIISSDFCHWGQRFRYTYYDESQGEIYRSIEHLDKMAVAELKKNGIDMNFSFLNYAQSSQCRNWSDSSKTPSPLTRPFPDHISPSLPTSSYRKDMQSLSQLGILIHTPNRDVTLDTNLLFLQLSLYPVFHVRQLG
ncbi:Protein MEMO1 [Anabarilius grahami]|uniref:Protein MEMO1 n=1 Tax=Anabarilius grahami TaxID=495550 RepID=A0A3N0YVF2_ANAGA|nr:Protein MEMO1 [Anabarilius grahami]